MEKMRVNLSLSYLATAKGDQKEKENYKMFLIPFKTLYLESYFFISESLESDDFYYKVYPMCMDVLYLQV